MCGGKCDYYYGRFTFLSLPFADEQVSLTSFMYMHLASDTGTDFPCPKVGLTSFGTRLDPWLQGENFYRTQYTQTNKTCQEKYYTTFNNLSIIIHFLDCIFDAR